MKKLTKIAARKRILKHLEKRGDDSSFTVTPDLVLYWWKLLNKAVFNDQLLTPRKIICRRFHDDWGWCIPLSKKGNVHIGINSEHHDRKHFLETLSHEMVHQWQWTKVGEMTHGKSFYQWKPVLKQALTLPLDK